LPESRDADHDSPPREINATVLTELLPVSRILLQGKAHGKQDVLGELARLLGEGDAALSQQVLGGLLDREEVMSTGIGHGIAIPHARLAAITEMKLALARYPHGVSFQSLDDQPVLLAFGVIGPPAEADRHVKLLARIARLVKQPGAVQEMLHAPTGEEVVAILRKYDP
jgi:PTS system nitrogen regulatory IIA component